MGKVPIAVEKTRVIEELDTDELLPLLPEGAVIKLVDDRGKPVLNVRVNEWQVAIPVAATVEATIANVVRAAWINECELEHDLLRAEVKTAYQAQLAELQDWHQQNVEDKVSGKMAAAKAARASAASA